MDWILPDYFNPVIAVSPLERMAATLHESAKPNMSQSEGDDPPQPAAAPSNSTQSPHNMKKTNGKSSKKGKKSKSCKSPQRSSKQDSNVDLHSDSADVPAKSSHGPVRIKGVKSKKAKTSKSKKSPQRSSRQDLSAGDSQSEPADVQSNSPHCPHKMKETNCKPAKKEKSGNSPKKTTKQPQHTEDAATCENDIQGAHTPKRKCSSKSRPAPGKKKGQNGKMPKPRCSRKQVSFTTPACDATDPEEEDIADSTTLFGSPESESGTSSAGWSRSKVTYAVGKKGRMSTPKARRRRAAPGCKRHLKAGAAPRPASERSAAPVSHPKRSRRNALVVAKPAVLFRDPNDPLGMLSTAFRPGLPVAGPSGSTAPPATVSAGPETAGPSTSAETDEEEDMEPLDDQQFDQEIQRKATKAKISVRNVKHIIKSIISNEQVLAMMRYAESREANPDGATLPPSMEPKMTRARARQLADTHLTQLPLTPVKRGSTADQLIAQEFPEDDDDDEYTPEKEVDESVATASPCSSPAPSSPRSPSVCSSQPQTPRTPGSVASEADEPLSRRTRSRLPLNDMALEELERLLVAPDVEPDTYFPVDDEDEDWVGFLRGFSAPPTSTDAPEEEEEDEEYVFQVQEEEEVEREEMRRDPAVRIPQKEVNKLMLELMKDVDELQWTDLPDPNQLPTQPIRIPKTPLTMMTDSQAKQLDHQMIAHVQLLAQTHMLCSEHDWLRAEQAGCAALLVELNSLSSTLHPEDPTRSFFHPPNLAPALQLVADVERMTPEQLADDPSKFFTASRQRYCRLADWILDQLMSSTAFVFPELLPVMCALRPEDQNRHRWTTPAIDQLIAMGLEMFTKYAQRPGQRRDICPFGVCRLMAEYMLPTTRRRLVERIASVRSLRDPTNPIQQYLDKKRAPPVPIVDALPKYPLTPLKARVKDLPEPWYSLEYRGNGFFLTVSDKKGVVSVPQHDALLGGVRQPVTRVLRQCKHCRETDYQQRYAHRQWKKNEDGEWEKVGKRWRWRKRKSTKKASSDGDPSSGCEETPVQGDILAMCMPAITDDSPAASDHEEEVEDPLDIGSLAADDPIGVESYAADDPPVDAAEEAEPEESRDEQQSSPSGCQLKSRQPRTAQKTMLTDASNGEELVTVVSEEDGTAPSESVGSPAPVLADGQSREVSDAGKRPTGIVVTAIAAPAGPGQLRLTPSGGSVIELKEEDGRLVVFIRVPGRPTLRVPVRASSGSTRLLLPPTLVLQEAAAGQPSTAGPAKQTGVVAPTVRQQEPQQEPPAVLTPPQTQETDGPPEPPPPEPMEEDGPPEPSSDTPLPESPLPVSAEPDPSPRTDTAEKNLFKAPLAPPHKITPPRKKATPHKKAAPLKKATPLKKASKVTVQHLLRRSPRLSKLSAPPEWLRVSEVYSVTANTTGTAASGDASASTSGGSAAGGDTTADGRAGSESSRGANAGAGDAATLGSPPADRGGPSGVSQPGGPAPAAGPSPADVPTMLPPSLMTPLRPSSPPTESGLLLGFPTPNITPAPTADGGEPSTPAMLETPLVRSPPAHALLETPQPQRSPPRSPNTPPPPPPPQLTASSDSHSSMSLSFFRRTVGAVQAAAEAAGPPPEQHLTSEQSLGGVLDALLTRPTEGQTEGQPETVKVEARESAPPVSASAAERTADIKPAVSGESSVEPGTANTPAAAPAAAAAAPVPATPATSSTAVQPPTASPAASGSRSQGVRTRSESASEAGTQRAPQTDTKPVLPAEATEETAAQTEEDRELASSSALPSGRSSRPKRSRQQREAELTRLAVAPESPTVRERREQALSESFLQRVRECTESVDPAIYQRFEKLLLDFPESSDDEVALYDSVCGLLRGFPDLADEFLMYVSEDVAVRRGLVAKHARLARLQELARGIDAVNAAHPSQVLKLARSLTQLTSRGEEVRPADLQAAVQPLVRGCPLLSAQLSSLLDSETPQPELTRREVDFQTAALDAEPADQFEEVTELEADEPDPYGTERCPCACHSDGEDVRFLQRRRHCERCGLRFMAGRVYLQTGKVLRPARVVSCSEPDEPSTSAAEPGRGDSSPPPKRARKRTVSRGRRPRSSPAARTGSSPPPPPRDPTPPPSEPPPPPPAAAAPAAAPKREPGPSEPAEPEPAAEPAPWSRDDDLEILTSCQRSGDGEKTFRAIQRRLPTRSVAQLRNRFQQLMEMLQQQMGQEPDEFVDEE